MMGLTAQYLDEDGWHDADLVHWGYVPDGTPEHAGQWACRQNDTLTAQINRGLFSGYIGDPMDHIIIRVVVTDRETGAKVCEWPVVEGEAI